MNILVDNLAAENSGALKVLEIIYDEMKKSTEHHFYLMVSISGFESTENITVLHYPDSKKSFVKRMKYDFFETKRLIKEHNIDIFLSLQNSMFCHRKCFNALYLQQSLQYLNTKARPWGNTKALWFRKYIIGSFINVSVKCCDSVFVQSEWMRELISGKTKKDVYIVPPTISIDLEKYKYNYQDRYNRFFYPAVASEYKNHFTILKAAKLLKDEGITDFEVVLTVGDKSEYEKSLIEYAKEYDLPIKFVGRLPYETVLKEYTSSTLLFLSDIETFGFPMLEMKVIGGPIIVSDMPYAHNVVGDYENASYIKHRDEGALKDAMKLFINGGFKCTESAFSQNNQTLVDAVVNAYKKKKNL